VALFLSPSIINAPFDLALGIVIPVHLHIGMSTVLTDYVPRDYQQLSLQVLWVISFLTGLGLLKINLCGPGITESVKSLWRRPERQLKHRPKENAEVEKAHAAKH